jgi:hypothetical protein
MTQSIQLPAGAFMHFNQSYGFENDSTTGYDGGVVEYSTNGGASWTDAKPLFEGNGYNGTIDSPGNPLNGRQAFVGESNGYISSRINLSSLVGQSVRFRFRIGTDSFGNDYGWFIDDVRIYTCAGIGQQHFKSYLPVIQNNTFEPPAPSGPTPGFWQSETADEFYVSADRANVNEFAIYVQAPGCGNFKIKQPTPVPIVNNQFAFTGAFYGSGTFTSATAVSGADGLNNFPIEACGASYTNAWTYTAAWKNSSQPTVVQRSGPITVEALESIKGHYIVTRVK